MKTISAIIVVKNNPTHLFESLASIDKLVSEIIIGNIDIGNDYKKRLLENKQVKIVNLPSDIPFADLVKEDLKKQAKGEYIIYLDPDEIFPTINSQPRQTWLSQLTSLMKIYDVFYFPRKNIIFGKWIEHSRWWPDYQIRLFKKNSVFWTKELHPVPQVKGKEYKFPPEERNAILHYNYDNLDQYLEKAIRYAKSEAAALQDYSLTKAIKNSISEFISRFFAAEGYKDGLHGFTLAVLQMFYYFLVFFYYWEKKKYFSEKQETLIENSKDFFRNGFRESIYWLVQKNLLNPLQKIKLKLIRKMI